MGAHDDDRYPTLFQNRVIVGHNLSSLAGLIRDVECHIRHIMNVIKGGDPYIGRLYIDLAGIVKTRICHYRKYDNQHAICFLYVPPDQLPVEVNPCYAQNANQKIRIMPMNVATAGRHS